MPLFLLPLLFFSGALFAQPHPDPASGVYYAKWGLALIPVAMGVFFQLLTLWITLTMVLECIRRGRYRRRSGFPFAGPIFISLGLWWSPSIVPVWAYFIAWGIELLGGIAFVLVRRATRAELEVALPASG